MYLVVTVYVSCGDFMYLVVTVYVSCGDFMYLVVTVYVSCGNYVSCGDYVSWKLALSCLSFIYCDSNEKIRRFYLFSFSMYHRCLTSIIYQRNTERSESV
ncbi:hypothetical protein OTU49_010639 [Cherax quadricarinatus]|uniref:Uncharacterized protein n=1 Tax=Cherax quadricarinatus TaxID=27406 RepID=A0AAW0W8J2_CHEQU